MGQQKLLRDEGCSQRRGARAEASARAWWECAGVGAEAKTPACPPSAARPRGAPPPRVAVGDYCQKVVSLPILLLSFPLFWLPRPMRRRAACDGSLLARPLGPVLLAVLVLLVSVRPIACLSVSWLRSSRFARCGVRCVPAQATVALLRRHGARCVLTPSAVAWLGWVVWCICYPPACRYVYCA